MSDPPSPQKKERGLGKAAKAFRRQVEKAKQKFGGANSDDLYNLHKGNFEKQQSQAKDLLKASERYAKALEGLLAATKGLNQAVVQACGTEWAGAAQATDYSLDLLSHGEAFGKQSEEEVIESLRSYVGLFSEHKKRMDKRERRKLDYDRAKRAVENARKAKSGKKLNEVELEYSAVKEEFESLDSAVCEELPVFYTGRLKFYPQLLQTLYDRMSEYHYNCRGVASNLGELMEKTLSLESEAGDEPTLPPSYSSSSALGMDNEDIETARKDGALDVQTMVQLASSEKSLTRTSESGTSVSSLRSAIDMSQQDPLMVDIPGSQIPQQEKSKTEDPPEDVTNKCLLKRSCSHDYDQQDEDELHMKKGDLIYVLPFPEPEDDEEGWAFGWSKGKFGMFPENFTIIVPESTDAGADTENG
eukprot:m.30391 g.30391  ORF g.30391 m.30391 type:complete len:416 (-) comp8199_c0_seq1:123-1370(-)